MDPKSIQGKWVAEVYDLLRLFRLVGRSVAGLFLIIVLWSSFLSLIIKPLASGDPASIHNAFSQLVGTEKVPLINIWLLGTAFIVVWWAWWSGAHFLIAAPVMHFAHTVAPIAIIFIRLILSPFRASWILVSTPIEARRIRHWLGTLSEEKRGYLETKLPMLKNRKWYAENSGFSHEWLLDWVNLKIDRLGLFHGRLGIAPILSQSYSEETLAAKAPPQALTWAVQRAGLHLGSVGRLKFLSIVQLPELFAVQNSSHASFVRWLFRCDVLIWGSYVTNRNGELWLNLSLSNEKVSPEASAHTASPDELTSEADSEQLFPIVANLRLPTVTVSQNEPRDIYATLLLAIFALLKNRQQHPKINGAVGYDLLQHTSTEENKVWYLFLNDAFSDWHDPIIRSTFLPLREAATRLVGAWLGSQFSPICKPSEKMLNYLHFLALRCVTLLPTESVNWYRLGAIKCAIGSVAEGFDCYRKAMYLELDSPTVNPISALTAIDIEGEKPADDDQRLAAMTAYVARVLGSGDDKDTKTIDEKIIAIASSGSLQYGSSDKAKAMISEMKVLIENAREKLTRRLAARLWELAGCPTGRDVEFWLDAESTVRQGKSRLRF